MDTERIEKQITELEEANSGELKGKRKKIRDLDILPCWPSSGCGTPWPTSPSSLHWPELKERGFTGTKDLEGLISIKLGKIHNLLHGSSWAGCSRTTPACGC